MELEQSMEDKGNPWTLMQHSKEDLATIRSIMDLTTGLYQQKIAVSYVVSPDISPSFAKLNQILSSRSGIAPNISLGGTRTLSEA